MTTPRRRRDAGIATHWLVCCFAVAIGAIVIASEATILPFHREQMRLAFSDEAFALAESGVELARAELARDGRVAEMPATPLGRGRVTLHVEAAQGDELVVVATGTVDAAPLGGKGTTLVRRIRARMKKGEGRPLVLDWKEL